DRKRRRARCPYRSGCRVTSWNASRRMGPAGSAGSTRLCGRLRAFKALPAKVRSGFAVRKRDKTVTLAKLAERREGLEEPERDAGEIAGHEQQADNDEEAAHHLFDRAQMLTEILEEREERPDGEGREQEGHAEPGRIDGKQRRAFPGRGLAGCDREDGGEDRPDARGPADGEGQAEQEPAQG